MHARGWEESPPCLPEYHRPEMPADDPILRKDSEAIEAPESSFVQETGLEIVVV